MHSQYKCLRISKTFYLADNEGTLLHLEQVPWFHSCIFYNKITFKISRLSVTKAVLFLFSDSKLLPLCSKNQLLISMIQIKRLMIINSLIHILLLLFITLSVLKFLYSSKSTLDSMLEQLHLSSVASQHLKRLRIHSLYNKRLFRNR